MTFKKLTDSQKAQVDSLEGAKSLMIQQPSMIKRPILKITNQFYLGFKEANYQSIFQV
jgi:arsenate reductase-like glutaredoxin family protein